MTQLNESPIITVERRKAVTIIIAAVIMSLAIGGGLMKVGSGFASRSSDGITVTGSAKTTATADNAVWVLNASLSSPTVATAVKKVDADVAALSKYLTEGGVAKAIEIGAVDEMITPAQTRSALAKSIANAPHRRGSHGNIPL